MKIIVNKQIIDTKNIFSISEVTEGAILQFEIVFFNEKFIVVEVDNYITASDLTFVRSLPKSEQSSALDKMNTERVEKFKKTWSELVSVWSDNQTTLPKFNF